MMNPKMVLLENESQFDKYLISDLWGNYLRPLKFKVNGRLRIDTAQIFNGLSEVIELNDCEKELTSQQFEKGWENLQVINQLANSNLTPIQKTIYDMFICGLSCSQIAKERGCSEANIRQAFWGNSKGQGGIIRKFKKLVKNYNLSSGRSMSSILDLNQIAKVKNGGI